jgi:hypothetical protein
MRLVSVPMIGLLGQPETRWNILITKGLHDGASEFV